MVTDSAGNSSKWPNRVRHLRDKGLTWSQIVDVLALDHHASPLRLHRLAANHSAAVVVDQFNQLDPATTAGLRVQRLYDYEKWPESGRRPPVRVLVILARIYQTAARRLVCDRTYGSYSGTDQADVDAADFSHLDPCHSRPVPVAGPAHEPCATAGDTTGRLAEPGQADPVELFRAVHRMEPDDERREVLFHLALVLGGVPGLALAHTLTTEERARLARLALPARRVDARTIAIVGQVVSTARRLYDARGPQPVLGPVMRFRSVIAELVAEVTGSAARKSLLRVHAELAQLAGWLRYDLTSYSAADRCFRDGLSAAQECGDAQLTAFIHCSLSQMASFRRQVATALDHAYAARGWAATAGSSRLASFAEQITAWASALDGDVAQTRQVLNRALALLPDQLGDGVPDYLRFVDHGFTLGSHACCSVLLRQPKIALPAAEDAFTLTDPALVRNRGFRLVDKAKALVLLKEIGEAARVAEGVADIAAGQGSVRLAHWLGDVRARLQPWAGTAEVRHLDEHIHELRLHVAAPHRS